MKNKIRSFLLLAALVATTLVVGCATAINTKDVTKITVTETGLKIGQNVANQTYEIIMGRSQVEYMKIPTGLNGTNATAGDAAIIPQTVSSYEANGHSAVFGNAAVTTTMSTGGTNAVNTTVGGEHPMINTTTGAANNLTPLSH
jgi:deoxyribose-phosphate aldolase